MTTKKQTAKTRIILTMATALTGCGLSADLGTMDEKACSTASGTYYMEATSCDGVNYSVDSLTINSDGTQFTWLQGSTACQKEVSYNATHTPPNLALSGTGSVRCFANGTEVASCNQNNFQCNNGENTGTLVMSFSTCVITGDNMQLIRAITQNDVDNGSSCQSGETETIDMSPTPSPRPQLIAQSNTDLQFYGVEIGNVRSSLVTVTNIGDAAAENLSITNLVAPFSFDGGTFPGVSGTCTSILAPGGSCTLDVVFSPTNAGTANLDMEISFSSSSTTYVLSENLMGVGLGPTTALLRFSPFTSYNFNQINVGLSFTDTVVVTNVGNGQATSISPQSLMGEINYDGGSYPGTGGTCGSTLDIGAACFLRIHFEPTTTGLKESILTLDYNNTAGSTSASLLLEGQGT